jgi:3-oxoadipate enol-lactonase
VSEGKTIEKERNNKTMPLAHVNSTAISYRLDGTQKGKVVMLSPSLAADITMWKSQKAALIEAGYRVLRYDSRGQGSSAVPPGPYSIEMLAEDAVGLMDALGLEEVHFCGLSMGGMVGQMLGASHSERLTSLTLSSTAAILSPREIWDERIETVRGSGMKSVVDATINRWFTMSGQARMPNEIEKVRRVIMNTPVDGYCACCAAIRDMDLRDSLNAISTQVLVLVGDQDPGTPVSAAEFIHGRIPSSELKIIPDAAHFVNVEQASAFNDALIEFITRIDKEWLT